MSLDILIGFLSEESIPYTEDAEMGQHTGFRCGGRAAVFAEPADNDSFIKLMRFTEENDFKMMLLGNGSNVFFPSSGYDGLVVSTKHCLSELYLTGDGYIYAGAGVMLAEVCRFAHEHSISGFENLYGIPGTVGGAVFMNAGAYGSEIRDVVYGVETMTRKRKKCILIANEDCHFSYRTSVFKKSGGIVLGALFRGSEGDHDEIYAKMQECMEKRRSKQPLEYPSCGSAFKRPEGYYAAALIEECGLKGYSIGGAMVSPKHAGFIINNGDASPEDIESLFRYVSDTVYEKKGVRLEREVIFV